MIHHMEIPDSHGRSLEVTYEIVEQIEPGREWVYARVLSDLPDDMDGAHYFQTCDEVMERHMDEMRERREAR